MVNISSIGRSTALIRSPMLRYFTRVNYIDLSQIVGTEQIAAQLRDSQIHTLKQLTQASLETIRKALSQSTFSQNTLDEWQHQAKINILLKLGEEIRLWAEKLVTSPAFEGSLGKIANAKAEEIREALGNPPESSPSSASTASAATARPSHSSSSTQPPLPPLRTETIETWINQAKVLTAARPATILTDLKDHNQQELESLRSERFRLLRKRDDLEGRLPPEHQKRLEEINEDLFGNKTEYSQDAVPLPRVFDPLYHALREDFSETYKRPFGYHLDGKLPSQLDREPLQIDEIALAAVYGILHRDHITDPTLGARFNNAVELARGEYKANEALFQRVLHILQEEGNGHKDTLNPAESEVRIDTQQWASVVRNLVIQGVDAEHPQLKVKVLGVLSSQLAAEDADPSSLEIDLPDLEDQTSVEIVLDNIKAMQAIYFAAMLEELKLFQVIDKLVELFQIGMLPVGRGNAGDRLFRWMKNSVTRFNEFERRNIYARTLGFAGGEAGGNPNRDFQNLWYRFVSAVSSFARQSNVDTMFRAKIPVRVSQEQVRKSGRDLAANLSLYGYGMAYHSATELQNLVNESIAILSDSEIKGAYGAKDMWGVVDQVAALELAGARDSIRYRTMATSGAVIIRWLAKKSNDLASVNMRDVLDISEINMPSGHPPGSKATTNPYDSDLVNACERWLAVTGTPDAQVEAYADPYESPAMTSRPIQLPAAARDLLQSVGVSPNGNGSVGLSHNGYGR